MKYIEVAEYMDVCSTAFVKAIDSIYDSSLYVESLDKIIINLSNKDVKDMFNYYIDKEIDSLSKRFGKKVIIIDTCTLKNNWKRYSISIDDRFGDCKFTIKDESLLINTVLLSNILTRKWKELCKKKDIISISHDCLDSHDIIQVVKKKIGKDYINHYQTPYKIIEDINLDMFGTSLHTLPEDLSDQIVNVLIKNKLITS
jgi:hypothetical protein